MTFHDKIIEYPERYAEATRARIIGNAMKTWRKNNPDHCDAIEAFLAAGRIDRDRFPVAYEDNFVGSLAKAFDTYGKLSEKQCAAVLKIIADRQEKRAAKLAAIEEQKARSAFLGVVAERVNMTLVVEKILEIPATKFSYYDSATQGLYLMRDEAGNRIILKTKTDVLVECDEGADRYFINDDGKSYRNVMEGDTIEVAATIKAHVEYKGEKQTLIQRVKVKRIILEKEAA